MLVSLFEQPQAAYDLTIWGVFCLFVFVFVFFFLIWGLFREAEPVGRTDSYRRDVTSLLRCLECGIFAKLFRTSYLYLFPHL